MKCRNSHGNRFTPINHLQQVSHLPRCILFPYQTTSAILRPSPIGSRYSLCRCKTCILWIVIPVLVRVPVIGLIIFCYILRVSYNRTGRLGTYALPIQKALLLPGIFCSSLIFLRKHPVGVRTLSLLDDR